MGGEGSGRGAKGTGEYGSRWDGWMGQGNDDKEV